MIKAVIFDLDGTLVRTEELKALSYARAAVSLVPHLSEGTIIDGYKDVVGLPRQEVSEYLVKKLILEGALQSQMQGYKVDAPWKVLAEKHVEIYKVMIETPGLLDKYKCPYNVGLLEYVGREGFLTGLATMSHRPDTHRVLEILGLNTLFNVIATREDIERGKPDPEIYLHVSRQLGVLPQESLVIEDSVNGIRSALAAGMACLAVTSTITRLSVHESGLVAKQWIVDDPALLMTVARQMIADRRVADNRSSLQPRVSHPS